MSKKWTKQEDDILKNLYPHEGKAVYLHLQGRSAAACQHRARRLGLCSENRWTEEEDRILRKYYPTEGGNVYLRLSNKNVDSCRKRASTLSIHSNNSKERWSKREEDYLVKHYAKKGAAGVAEHLKKRSAEACRRKAFLLGIHVDVIDFTWLDEEKRILEQFYPVEGSYVAERLSGRSREACISKANLMGIKYKGHAPRNFDLRSSFMNHINTKITIERFSNTEYGIVILIDGKRLTIRLCEDTDGKMVFTDNGEFVKSLSVDEKDIERYAMIFGVEYEQQSLRRTFDFERCGEQLVNMILCIVILIKLDGK